MRISDWSSDVCSSDLQREDTNLPHAGRGHGTGVCRSGCGCDGRSASTPLFFSAPQRHDPHLRITKLALERRRGYEAGEGEHLAQATSCFHQKVPVTQSEQESTASPNAEDGLNTGAWQLDRKSTRLNSSHSCASRMPSSA